MSRWDDQVQAHPVRGSLAEIAERLRSVDVDAHGEEGREFVERAARAVARAVALIEAAEPTLVTESMLNSLLGAANVLSGAIDNYLGNPIIDHVRALQPGTDAILDACARFPVQDEESVDRRELDELVAHISTASSMAISKVREEARSLQEAIDAERVQSSDRLEEINQRVETLAGNAAASEVRGNEELERLAAALTDFQTRVDATINEWQARRDSIATDSQNAFQQQLADHKNVAQSVTEQATHEFADARQSYESRSNEAIAALEELQKQAAELVGLVAENATAGGFKTHADDEKKTADIWRLVSVGATIGIVVAGVWVLIWSHTTNHVEWTGVGAKALVTLPLAALAAYAGSQSASHPRQERRARKMQLELVALDPLIANLNPEDRQRIKSDFVPRAFGQPDDYDETRADASSTSVIAGLLDALNKAVSALSKR